MKVLFLFTDSDGELLTLKGLLTGTEYRIVQMKENPELLNDSIQSRPDLLIFLEPLKAQEKLIFKQVVQEKYPTLIITQSEELTDFSEMKKKGNVAVINKPFGRLTLITILDLLTKNKLEYLFLKSGHNERIKIPLDEIVYLEASLNYCYIKTQSKKFIQKISMKKLLEALNDNFVRISSQHAVNMNYVEKFTSSSVFLKGEELKIGSSYRSLFRKSTLT